MQVRERRILRCGNQNLPSQRFTFYLSSCAQFHFTVYGEPNHTLEALLAMLVSCEHKITKSSVIILGIVSRKQILT